MLLTCMCYFPNINTKINFVLRTHVRNVKRGLNLRLGSGIANEPGQLLGELGFRPEER